MANEISAYIDECYKAEQGEKLKDVYVTDHSSPDIKYLSKSEEEDEDLYAYQKSIDEYNDDNSAGAVYTPKAPIYPKSSMMQICSTHSLSQQEMRMEPLFTTWRKKSLLVTALMTKPS